MQAHGFARRGSLLGAFNLNSGQRVGLDAKSRTRFPVRETKQDAPALEAEVVSSEPESNSYAQYADTSPQPSTAEPRAVESVNDEPRGLLAMLLPRTSADWAKLVLGLALAYAAKRLFGGK